MATTRAIELAAAYAHRKGPVGGPDLTTRGLDSIRKPAEWEYRAARRWVEHHTADDDDQLEMLQMFGLAPYEVGKHRRDTGR
jgi:hypothetical protein